MSGNMHRLYSYPTGGGNIGSIAILVMFSSIVGMRRDNMGEDRSKHGLVLHSINSGFKSESIIKSNTNNSYVGDLWFRSNFQKAHLIVSIEISLIYVNIYS
jgi:hypothetical protein